MAATAVASAASLKPQPTHAALASALPLRLRSFFAANPPRYFLARQFFEPDRTIIADARQDPSATTLADAEVMEGAPSRPLTPSGMNTGERSAGAGAHPPVMPHFHPLRRLNPFLPHKHPHTARWHPPIYSLRRQADLCALAREHGVESMLPYTTKRSDIRLKKRVDLGLRVKGTGVGERVKGHKSERTLKGRLEARRVAMLGMQQLIKEWKTKGHGRGWKKWPK